MHASFSLRDTPQPPRADTTPRERTGPVGNTVAARPQQRSFINTASDSFQQHGHALAIRLSNQEAECRELHAALARARTLLDQRSLTQFPPFAAPHSHWAAELQNRTAAIEYWRSRCFQLEQEASARVCQHQAQLAADRRSRSPDRSTAKELTAAEKAKTAAEDKCTATNATLQITIANCHKQAAEARCLRYTLQDEQKRHQQTRDHLLALHERFSTYRIGLTPPAPLPPSGVSRGNGLAIPPLHRSPAGQPALAPRAVSPEPTTRDLLGMLVDSAALFTPSPPHRYDSSPRISSPTIHSPPSSRPESIASSNHSAFGPDA